MKWNNLRIRYGVIVNFVLNECILKNTFFNSKNLNLHQLKQNVK